MSKERLRIGIVNYGVGNLLAVRNAFMALGHTCKISSDHNELESADLVVLPGVGAFRPASEALRQLGLADFLLEYARRERPIIGICLGMQLLADRSYEGGATDGLGLIPGNVVALDNTACHVGWGSLLATDMIDEPQLRNLVAQSSYYFNHSFVYESANGTALAKADFQGQSFPAIVKRGQVMGFQFHPEKSQEAGRALLQHILFRMFHGE